MNSRKCDVCNIAVHRASYIKHLRSKKIFRKYKTERIDNTGIVFSRNC